MKKICFTLLIVISAIALQAQNVSTLRFMRLNPTNNLDNPAYNMPYDWYMSLPFIGQNQLTIGNSVSRIGILHERSDGTFAISGESFLKRLKDNNWVDLNMNMQFINLGFRVNKNFFTINHGIRLNARFDFSDDLFKLLIKGNGHFMGEDNPARINLVPNLDLYQELAVGYQRVINDQWTVGGRQKILFGLANFRTKNLNGTIHTAPETYAVSLNYDLDARISSFIPIDFEDTIRLGKFNNFGASIFGNFGLGFDLGATYQINDQFRVAASITDLGFIHWSQNASQLESQPADAGVFFNDGQFFFDGIHTAELQQLINDTAYRASFFDSILAYFPIDATDINGYTTSLNTNFAIEGSYDLNEMHRFTALFQGMIYRSSFYPAFTLAYNGNFFNIIDVCVNYTIKRRNYDNLGIGIGFNLGGFNIYAATNNLISLIRMQKTNRFNIQAGIVFNFKYKN